MTRGHRQPLPKSTRETGRTGMRDSAHFILARLILLSVLGFLSITLTGCSGFKLVRIPSPIPTSGLSETKIARQEPPIRSPRLTFRQSTNPTTSTNTTNTTTATPDKKLVEVGQASWYGQKFHGKPTASGEPYSMFSMTAAHPTLPFNSKIKVTNLENGKVVYVRINDRGPYVKGRILDVSKSAARKLGFDQKGIATIQLEAL